MFMYMYMCMYVYTCTVWIYMYYTCTHVHMYSMDIHNVHVHVPQMINWLIIKGAMTRPAEIYFEFRATISNFIFFERAAGTCAYEHVVGFVKL